jgi:hypothetical protein
MKLIVPILGEDRKKKKIFTYRFNFFESLTKFLLTIIFLPLNSLICFIISSFVIDSSEVNNFYLFISGLTIIPIGVFIYFINIPIYNFDFISAMKRWFKIIFFRKIELKEENLLNEFENNENKENNVEEQPQVLEQKEVKIDDLHDDLSLEKYSSKIKTFVLKNIKQKKIKKHQIIIGIDIFFFYVIIQQVFFLKIFGFFQCFMFY